MRPTTAPRHGPAGLDWETAEAVERPAGMDAAPPSIPPVASGGGGLGHPGHFSGQGSPYDVAARGDRLIAVGYTYPGFQGATWTSTDRRTWSLGEIDRGRPDTFLLSVAGGPRRWVIVGRRATQGAAWWSPDGHAWETAAAPSDQSFAELPETRLTSVVAAADGFIAGGWTGLITAPGMARFWISADGQHWTRSDEGPGAGDGRVVAIAAGPGGFVAVGTTGSVGRPTGSAVWRSRDGLRWERVPDSDVLHAGVMASVVAGGPGYVAVGATLERTAAMAWTSTDGRTWQAAPAQESLTFHGLRITMSDVTAGSDGSLVAVGHFLFGQQFGQGTSWLSSDGVAWTRAPDLAVLGQGEPAAVIPDGAGYVAIGTVGAPDNFIPSVWLSPPSR